MSIEHDEYIDAAPDVVWNYFSRPGAMRRLTPAWSPLTPQREADSLQGGTAVLGLPGPFTWHARHQPQGFRDGEQFVDVVASGDWRSLPTGVLRWQHTHRVLAEGTGTRLIDAVNTPVPGAALRPMFRWRAETLRSDLAAQARLATAGQLPTVVAITGSRGMVGQALAAFLGTAGVRVIRLVRGAASGPDERTWDPEHPASDLLVDVDAVAHLAGEPIAGRFTRKHRANIRDSRVGPTRKLAELAANTPNGPRAFVCASAIGIYGAQRPGEVLDEHSTQGDDFLADVVREWERATEPAERAGLRTVQVRTGIALSAGGGVLRLLRAVYRTGLGGPLGNGRQMMSWIDLDDLTDIYCRALVDSQLSGPVNATAEQSVSAATFAQTLGKVMRRPAKIPVPAIGPMMLLGKQGANELALADQNVVPQRLLERGHYPRRPGLEDSLRHQLGRF